MRTRSSCLVRHGSMLRHVVAVVLVGAAMILTTVAVTAAQPSGVTGGGETTITTLVFVDGSTMPAAIPTHLGLSAIMTSHGPKGQFQCLINGPGFTGNFMNLHGDVDWVIVDGNTASFGGDSNFGPYSVVVKDGPTTTISLRWTTPFGPGIVGTEEVLTQGTIRIRD